MEITPENKATIDSKSLESLLRDWRMSPSGNPWLQGETGEYWDKRVKYLRSLPGGDNDFTRAAKKIGW